jgi:hypothetical protein
MILEMQFGSRSGRRCLSAVLKKFYAMNMFGFHARQRDL